MTFQKEPVQVKGPAAGSPKSVLTEEGTSGKKLFLCFVLTVDRSYSLADPSNKNVLMEFKEALDKQREEVEKSEKEKKKEKENKLAKSPPAKEKNDFSDLFGGMEFGDDEEAMCEVCYGNPPDSVYMPCGHGGMCYDCAIDIWKKSDDCYLCRKVS